MRYGLIPENPAEEQVLLAHPAARPLFDPLIPVIQARALCAAVKHRVFEALGAAPRTIEELASELRLDAGTLELLARVLCSAGYLRLDAEGRLGVTELCRATLLEHSPARLSAWVRHALAQWRAVEQLSQVLECGEPFDLHRHLDGPGWATYQEAMLETARTAAGWVASQVPVPDGAGLMLDIGGAHGLYGAAICREHPPLRSEVLDLPQAIEHGRELARREGIDDVVTHRRGDALTAAIPPDSCDLVFLGNIVHHFTVDQCRALLGRIHAALRPGGTVAIWDFRRPPRGAPPDVVSDGLALLFQITSGTRCYGGEELAGWLAERGFVDVEDRPAPAPTQILLVGRRPSP